MVSLSHGARVRALCVKRRRARQIVLFSSWLRCGGDPLLLLFILVTVLTSRLQQAAGGDY